jgi:hypothetical protein
MAEFIVNPRRAPRAPARCHAVVRCRQARFEAETEDIGSMGCQIVSPWLVQRDEPVELTVTNEKVEGSLEARGRVAWVSAQAPWRVGIAFEDASLPRSTGWFDGLLAAYPGLSGLRRVPDRIRTDASVYLGAPPRFLVDFTADEATLLRAIASGARVDELIARFRDRWPALQRALFSLVARGAVTFQRGQAMHPDSWRKILTEVEASLALEGLGQDRGLRAPIQPPPAPAPAPLRELSIGAPGPQPHGATRELELGDDVPSLELADSAPVPVAVDPGSDGEHRPSRDFSGAGVGWRKVARRSAEAQAAYEGGLAALQAGNVSGALGLLRRALALAPGDAEIAQQLGALAFKDRLPGDR